MNCPLCIDQVLEPHHRAGIEIDVCPNCRGVWLDRNELETLVGSTISAAPPQPEPVRSERDERSKQSKSKKKSKKSKKKSWGDLLGDALEEVLDF